MIIMSLCHVIALCFVLCGKFLHNSVSSHVISDARCGDIVPAGGTTTTTWGSIVPVDAANRPTGLSGMLQRACFAFFFLSVLQLKMNGIPRRKNSIS